MLQNTEELKMKNDAYVELKTLIKREIEKKITPTTMQVSSSTQISQEPISKKSRFSHFEDSDDETELIEDSDSLSQKEFDSYMSMKFKPDGT